MPRQASDGSERGFNQGVEELEISLAEVVYGDAMCEGTYGHSTSRSNA